jgi:hypothetical protein
LFHFHFWFYFWFHILLTMSSAISPQPSKDGAGMFISSFHPPRDRYAVGDCPTNPDLRARCASLFCGKANNHAITS